MSKNKKKSRPIQACLFPSIFGNILPHLAEAQDTFLVQIHISPPAGQVIYNFGLLEIMPIGIFAPVSMHTQSPITGRRQASLAGAFNTIKLIISHML